MRRKWKLQAKGELKKTAKKMGPNESYKENGDSIKATWKVGTKSQL